MQCAALSASRNLRLGGALDRREMASVSKCIPLSRVVPAAFRARSGAINPHRVRPAASPSPSPITEAEADESTVNYAGEYCAIDPATRRPAKRTLGDLENEYLLALSSWYNEAKPIMTDAEFEVLKEELMWNGSKVVVLDSDEQRFLNAAMAYFAGKPIMSDEDFDMLKATLKMKNSVVTAQGPRCSLRSKKMYGDAAPDYLRMLALNLPAVLLVLGFVFAIDDITGFEISEALELPPPWDLIAFWLVVPIVVAVSYTLTNLLFKDYLVLKAKCPNCGEANFTYFGSILTVAGNRGQNSVECSNCKALLTFDELKRVVVVDETGEERQEKLAAEAAKKEAAAKKKAARAAAAASRPPE